jgi:hypothetical protein
MQLSSGLLQQTVACKYSTCSRGPSTASASRLPRSLGMFVVLAFLYPSGPAFTSRSKSITLWPSRWPRFRPFGLRTSKSRRFTCPSRRRHRAVRRRTRREANLLKMDVLMMQVLAIHESRRMPELANALPSHLLAQNSQRVPGLANALSPRDSMPQSARVVGNTMSGHTQHRRGQCTVELFTPRMSS